MQTWLDGWLHWLMWTVIFIRLCIIKGCARSHLNSLLPPIAEWPYSFRSLFSTCRETSVELNCHNSVVETVARAKSLRFPRKQLFFFRQRSFAKLCCYIYNHQPLLSSSNLRVICVVAGSTLHQIREAVFTRQCFVTRWERVNQRLIGILCDKFALFTSHVFSHNTYAIERDFYRESGFYSENIKIWIEPNV